jgi:hypothetical protein
MTGAAWLRVALDQHPARSVELTHTAFSLPNGEHRTRSSS